MYACSCNALTERDIHAAIEQGARHPREVYAAKGCKAQCGGCTAQVVCMLKQHAAPALAEPAMLKPGNAVAPPPAQEAVAPAPA